MCELSFLFSERERIVDLQESPLLVVNTGLKGSQGSVINLAFT
jgi:hypothetical protein